MLTENQRAVLAVLDEAAREGLAATVPGLLRERLLGQVTTARIAGSLHTLVGDGLARYDRGDPSSIFTASYTITDQGRAALAQED